MYLSCAFAYSAWFGSGSSAFAFLLRSDVSSTQIPNSTQIGLAEQNARDIRHRRLHHGVRLSSTATSTSRLACRGFRLREMGGSRALPQANPLDPLIVDGTAAITSTAFRA